MKWNRNILPRNFYDRNPEKVARDILGKYLVRKTESEFLVGKIVEVEAYLPKGDSASHNFKGPTNRNKSLYKNAGHAYVHSMRQYRLLDIVTQGEGAPGSVLVRAVEPIEGIDTMEKIRGEFNLEKLANGPGKICDAFKIRKDFDGMDLTDSKQELYIVDGETIPKTMIAVSARIGISSAQDAMLRFYVKGSKSLSRKHRD